MMVFIFSHLKMFSVFHFDFFFDLFGCHVHMSFWNRPCIWCSTLFLSGQIIYCKSGLSFTAYCTLFYGLGCFQPWIIFHTHWRTEPPLLLGFCSVGVWLGWRRIFSKSSDILMIFCINVLIWVMEGSSVVEFSNKSQCSFYKILLVCY